MKVTRSRTYCYLFVSLFLLTALLAINIFIFSPWHKHSTLTRELCPFFQFEHASAHQPVVQAHAAPTATTLFVHQKKSVVAQLTYFHSHWQERAPPAAT